MVEDAVQVHHESALTDCWFSIQDLLSRSFYKIFQRSTPEIKKPCSCSRDLVIDSLAVWELLGIQVASVFPNSFNPIISSACKCALSLASGEGMKEGKKYEGQGRRSCSRIFSVAPVIPHLSCLCCFSRTGNGIKIRRRGRWVPHMPKMQRNSLFPGWYF